MVYGRKRFRQSFVAQLGPYAKTEVCKGLFGSGNGLRSFNLVDAVGMWAIRGLAR